VRGGRSGGTALIGGLMAHAGAGGEERGVPHETLDLDRIDAGVEQVRGEGAPAVMGAEMADAGLAGPPVDEGTDGLGGEAPQRDPARLVDGAEEGPGSSRPRTSSQAVMARRPPAGRAVRRWRRPLPVTVRWRVWAS
jgi:hypothetical protein